MLQESRCGVSREKGSNLRDKVCGGHSLQDQSAGDFWHPCVEQRPRTSRDLAREGGEWVADLCPPGTGKQQQGFVEVAIPCCSRGFCVDGLPGCQPSFLGPLPSWNLPSEIKTAQLMQGCRGCLRHQAGSAARIPALSSLGLCDWRTVLPPSPRDCLR